MRYPIIRFAPDASDADNAVFEVGRDQNMPALLLDIFGDCFFDLSDIGNKVGRRHEKNGDSPINVLLNC